MCHVNTPVFTCLLNLIHNKQISIGKLVIIKINRVLKTKQKYLDPKTFYNRTQTPNRTKMFCHVRSNLLRELWRALWETS